MIEIVQTNINVDMWERLSIIKEVPASDNFFDFIYTSVLKFLATMSTMIWILDSGARWHVFGDWTRFLDLTDYDDFYYIASGEQLAIKSKRNIDLSVRDKVLRLSDALYVLGLTVNLISTTRLWHNGISIYFSASWPMKLSSNRTIFTYTDYMRV